MNGLIKAFQLKLALWCLILLGSCQQHNSTTQQHNAEIERWREKRINYLKENWLPLAGLYWLEPGINTFGSDSANQLVFPPDFPKFYGLFSLDSGTVSIRINFEKSVSQKEGEGGFAVVDVEQIPPQVFVHGSFRWWVIARSSRYAIRLKDINNLRNFKDPSSYPISSQWKLAASYTHYQPPKTLFLMDVLGMEREQQVPGFVSFRVEGKDYQLDVLPDGFIIFGDDTNGLSTYGAGRYLYIDVPDTDGSTVLDFNKAFNPPCVYTDFATCPLPPRQNILPIGIVSGEKYLSHL